MEAKTIQKYQKYTTPELRVKAGKKFRKWIRERDKGETCISCGTPYPSDAGHFYPAGHYPELEFNPDNCHLQCRSCNYYQSANLHKYRKNLILKIGNERVEKLDEIVARFKHTGYKHDRFNLISIIEQYK